MSTLDVFLHIQKSFAKKVIIHYKLNFIVDFVLFSIILHIQMWISASLHIYHIFLFTSTFLLPEIPNNLTSGCIAKPLDSGKSR